MTRRAIMHRWRRRVQTPGYPRIWNLLGFLLPRKIRERVFAPAHEELKADYYYAYRTYRSNWARAWLRFCFAFRTILVLLDCFRAMGLDKLARALPMRLRQWWIG